MDTVDLNPNLPVKQRHALVALHLGDQLDLRIESRGKKAGVKESAPILAWLGSVDDAELALSSLLLATWGDTHRWTSAELISKAESVYTSVISATTECKPVVETSQEPAAEQAPVRTRKKTRNRKK